MRRHVSLAFLVCIVGGCTPTHTVRPLPDFVATALDPGDRVTVTTHKGEEFEFIVADIQGNTIVGESVTFRLEELASIRKHAWQRPDSPCGGEKPLGCSLPFLVALSSELHGHYSSVFHDACEQHDYCYRHGFASYGLDRDACDAEFLANMQATCPAPPAGKAGKVLEVFNDSLDSRSNCLTVANDYHAAVRRYGEKRFETTGSTYCEYNGPPVSAIR